MTTALLDVVLAPALWLSVFLAAVYSSLFYLWHGGGWRQLGFDLLAGLGGFAVGQLLGMGLGLPGLRLGDVQLVWGTLACVIGLVLARNLPRGRRTTGKAHAVAQAIPTRKSNRN